MKDKVWYRGDLTVQDNDEFQWFVAQTLAASADEAIEQIEKQLLRKWHIPMMSVGPISEPLKPGELGWQSKTH